MTKINVIITGASGMVGEGVLMECLQNETVAGVLMINRKHLEISHPKLKELIVTDFTKLDQYSSQLVEYDACFYCAGVSSVGMREAEYTRITYDTTLSFAQVLLAVNPTMVFNFVTGTLTNTNGSQMWQRVKGRTEDALMKLAFRGQYNFRPGAMSPVAGEKNVKSIYKPFIWFFSVFIPARILSLHEVGKAMIHTVTRGADKQVLEVKDIRALAK